MPRTAPPADVAVPRGPTRSATDRAARVERVRDAREFATLEAQLRALGSDIRAVRRTARRATAAQGVGMLGHHEDAPPPPQGEHVRLPDGAEIVIRQVGPEDAAQLKAGFEHLGAVSRYRRFLAPVDHLSPKQLSYLTHVDHISHEAIVALDAVTGDGIGIARFLRDPDDPRLAEVAIVVIDAWQGRGVGKVLVDRLAAACARSGGPHHRAHARRQRSGPPAPRAPRRRPERTPQLRHGRARGQADQQLLRVTPISVMVRSWSR